MRVFEVSEGASYEGTFTYGIYSTYSKAKEVFDRLVKNSDYDFIELTIHIIDKERHRILDMKDVGDNY